MSLTRLTAIVAVLVIGTAFAVDAYVDAQRGSLPVSDVGAPILEFGPSYPMPRPLRAAPPAHAERRPERDDAPIGLVRASRPVSEETPEGLEKVPEEAAFHVRPTRAEPATAFTGAVGH